MARKAASMLTLVWDILAVLVTRCACCEPLPKFLQEPALHRLALSIKFTADIHLPSSSVLLAQQPPIPSSLNIRAPSVGFFERKATRNQIRDELQFGVQL
jgi:hypothetical protein